MTVITMRQALIVSALIAALDLFAEGEPKMPMLNWMGRKTVTNAVNDVAVKILREDKALGYCCQCENVANTNVANGQLGLKNGTGNNGTMATFDNILIQGDNLDALKALLPFYAGEVKCIYIDPPYNTGAAFDHYDDNLEHSIWLNMMYPRLKLLRDFLREDGSIWISIDDHEGHYLKVICDEIFGRKNFVSDISWQRTYSTRNDAKGIVNEVEHILVYSKREGWQPKKLARTEEMDKKYKNIDNDPLGRWRNSDAFAPGASTHQGMVYSIQNPFTGEMLYPYDGGCWRYEQNEMLAIMSGWAEYELRDINDEERRATICGVGVNEVRKGVKAIVLAKSLEESKKSAQAVLKRGQWPRYFFSKNGQGGIARKTYLSAVGDVPPTNLFEYKDVGHTDEAKKEVLKVFDGQSSFSTPKPERLIKRIFEIASDEGDLVLDSFLGSGTTTAVAHKMGRRWIGIEMDETAKTHCAVRMRKVIDGEQGGISKSVNWQGGGGFRFYELGEAILKEDGTLTADIPFDAMAAHVWFTETKTPYAPPKARTTVLGVHEGVAYALLYNGILKDRSVDGGNVLTRKTLETIQPDLAGLDYKKIVVYGEACRLMPPTLESLKMEFRQTPYDLVMRK